MALLDTTLFIDLLGRGGKKRALEAEIVLRDLLSQGHELWTSRFNLAELYVGAELGDDPATERAAVDDILSWVGILEFDDNSARRYAQARAYLQTQGRLVGDLDMLIGGTALANDHPVVTRNAAHFRQIPGLTVIGYGRP